MSNLFGGLNGISFPDVVMNQGPLPGMGRLPNPLHDVPDSRINYGSTLLGDITPYSYGGPAYLSSQNAYLHTPHRVQKVVPVLHLPEPDRPSTFPLSHGVDDSDLVFVMRLDKNSVFCKGTKSGRALGTVIDPLINLPTLNYILAGVQLLMSESPDEPMHLWKEFLNNLDPARFPNTRNWGDEPISLADVRHIVRNCIRPLGIMRGSEKQGGQNEATLSAATWPVPFIGTLVVDGKESNVVNIWHHKDISAGDDLVLRLDVKPLERYTLNHYYKRFERKSFEEFQRQNTHVWQLVPDVLHHDLHWEKDCVEMRDKLGRLPPTARRFLSGFSMRTFYNVSTEGGERLLEPEVIMEMVLDDNEGRRMLTTTWHQLGYWYIGKSLVMMRAYGFKDFYNDDMANMLSTNHLEITFQPCFAGVPIILQNMPLLIGDDYKNITHVGEKPVEWRPSLMLEKTLQAEPAHAAPVPDAGQATAAAAHDTGRATAPSPAEAAEDGGRGSKAKKPRRAGGEAVGTLLSKDGSVEHVDFEIIKK